MSMYEPVTLRRALGGLATCYGLIAAAYWWDETAPLGWWTLKPKTSAEMEMAKYYRRDISRSKREVKGGKEEDLGVGVYLSRGGSSNTILVPRFGRDRSGSKDARVMMYDEMVERESGKLWLRMKREALGDLRSQGYDKV